MLTVKRTATMLLGALLGLGIASVVLLAGPRTRILCASGTGLEGFAERILQGMGAGHGDGDTGSYCPVPSTAAWLSAYVAVLAAFALTVLALRRNGDLGGIQ